MPGRQDAGFTLIELLVVVLIIGILAAIAVPQYFKVVEKGKSSEVLTTMDSIRGAQERFLAMSGNYCTAALPCAGMDLTPPTLKYFTLSAASAGAGSPSWKATGTRNTAVAGYGAYVVTYDVEPAVKPSMTCNNASCTTDLLPQ
jgi:type IV pilus assembly protein PilE